MPFEQSSGDGSGDNRVHTEPYTIKEFRGHYHVHKIESKRPILGTQVKVELARLEWRHKHAERLEQSSIQRNLKAKKDRELRVKTFKVLQKMRENYGVGKTFNRIQAIVDARGKEVERMHLELRLRLRHRLLVDVVHATVDSLPLYQAG